MNILQIVPQIPFPIDNGGRIVIFNTAKYLALRGHTITMLAINGRDEIDLSELQKYCVVKVVRHDTGNSLTGMALNLFSKMPYTISKYYSHAFIRKLNDIIGAEKIDIVHVDHLHMAFYGELLKKKFALPVVLRQHNIETVIWERFYPLQVNPLKKAYAFLQYKKIKTYEKKVCQIFDRVLAITEDDLKRIKELDSSVKAVVVPAGVDTEYFCPQNVKVEPKSIAFVGSMDWAPNIDGIQWFVKLVFPLIKRKSPGAKLCLIGSNPGKEIMGLHAPDIDIKPNVADIRGYLSKSEVVIVPLRIGGGMRLKILEAMAMRKPVISTSIGCEGIDIESGREIFVADDEEIFAGHVLKLFEDGDFCEKLAIRGYEKVLSKYSWKMIAESLENEYRRVILEHRKIRNHT